MALSESIKQIAIFDECIYRLFSSQFIEITLKENGFCLLYWTRETFFQTGIKIPLTNHFDANYMMFSSHLVTHLLVSGRQCKKITSQPESLFHLWPLYMGKNTIVSTDYTVDVYSITRVVISTGLTHSTNLVSCTFEQGNRCFPFLSCYIPAEALTEVGHCCLPKVKSYRHLFYLHSPPGSKRLTFCLWYSI